MSDFPEELPDVSWHAADALAYALQPLSARPDLRSPRYPEPPRTWPMALAAMAKVTPSTGLYDLDVHPDELDGCRTLVNTMNWREVVVAALTAAEMALGACFLPEVEMAVDYIRGILAGWDEHVRPAAPPPQTDPGTFVLGAHHASERHARETGALAKQVVASICAAGHSRWQAVREWDFYARNVCLQAAVNAAYADAYSRGAIEHSETQHQIRRATNTILAQWMWWTLLRLPCTSIARKVRERLDEFHQDM